MIETKPALGWTDGLPVLRTERLTLRLPRKDEVMKIHRFVVGNREHVRPFESTKDESYFRQETWIDAPEQCAREAKLGEGYRFRVHPHGDESKFIAHIALRDIWRDNMQIAQLGYTVDHDHCGQGVATECVQAVVWFAFEILDLHRIEACYMPSNLASARVLQKCGFTNEGTMRGSSRINGSWEDHILAAILNPAWRGIHLVR